jgi:hypothetical protein
VRKPCPCFFYTNRLEVIISETSSKEGPHLDVNEQNPEGVYFTSHK